MRALIAQLATATSDPTIDATATAATMTVVTIRTVVVIGQKDPNLVNITTTDQTTSSPLLMNLALSTTTKSSIRRSSKAHVLSTRIASTR